MKLLATLTVGLVAAPALTVSAVTLLAAACLASAPACFSAASTDAATDGQYQPAAPITAAELDAIGRAIGAPVPAYSALRDPDAYGTGWGGPSINLLAPTMKLAVARFEIATGQRLQIVSGYRTPGYQAQLCPDVTGPCARPGRSMHQHGLAVDATNWTATLPYLGRVGLCQPLPTNDAGHLSHLSGREC